jgi:hypothetical protein
LTPRERKYLEVENPLARYRERQNKAEDVLLDFRREVRKCDFSIVRESALVTGFYKRIEVEFPEIAKLDKAADETWMNRDKVQTLRNHETTSKT